MMTVEMQRTMHQQDEGFVLLVKRIRGEFLEMPGLRLTLPQAVRLWALDRPVCERILDALAANGFLSKNPEGTYGRVSVR